jgi:hypothetical protein
VADHDEPDVGALRLLCQPVRRAALEERVSTAVRGFGRLCDI